MKIISENLKPQSAETISVLLTVAAFAGPLIAGFFSILFDWKMTFYITAIFAVLFAFGSFLILTVFEKKKLITFTYKKENIFSGIRRLFCFKNFLFYLIVGAIAEIVASSVTYWIPSYLSEYLSLSTESIAAVFSLISLINIISPLICVFLYHRLIKDNVKLNLIFFGIAIVFFLLLSVSQSSPIANICFFIIAKTAIGCSSTTLWGIYIPSLASENVVSTGNGFFDFSGYAIASIFNALFSGFIDRLGWDGIILMWVFIMVIGFLSTLTVIIKDRHTADVDID